MEIKRLVKDCIKRIFAVSFCIVFIFLASYKRPVKAQAAATACTIAGCVLLATALTALGIGVSAQMNNGSYTDALNHAWNDMSEGVKQQATIIGATADYVRYELTKDFLVQGLNAVRKYYPDSTPYTGNPEAKQVMDMLNWPESYGDKLTDSYGLGYALYYGYLNNPVVLRKYVPAAGTVVTAGPYQLRMTNVNTYGLIEPRIYWDNITSSSVSGWNLKGVGTGGSAFDSLMYAKEIAVIQSEFYTNSVKNYRYIILAESATSYMTCAIAYPLDGTIATPSYPDVYNPANRDLYAEGQSALNHSVNDIADRLTEAQGGSAGKVRVKVDTSGRVGTIDKINDDIKSKTQEQVTETSITDATTTAENDRTNTDRDKTVPTPPKAPSLTIPELITRKFPFCLPFDFVAAVKTIQAPKKPPVFVVPLLKVPKWGWDYSVTLDWEKFDSDGKLSAVVRWSLSILWSIGLIFVTKKLIWK